MLGPAGYLDRSSELMLLNLSIPACARGSKSAVYRYISSRFSRDSPGMLDRRWVPVLCLAGTPDVLGPSPIVESLRCVILFQPLLNTEPTLLILLNIDERRRPVPSSLLMGLVGLLEVGVTFVDCSVSLWLSSITLYPSLVSDFQKKPAKLLRWRDFRVCSSTGRSFSSTT